MTAERIAELRALAEAATPGPWEQAPGGSVVTGDYEVVAMAHRTNSNAAFIAAARTALPEALNSIEWVRTQCELWLHYPEDYVPLNKVAEMILAALEGKPA